MVGKIFPFELRTRFASPLTWIILLMMCFQGIWYALAVYDFYVHDQSFINGAGIFYICLTGGGFLLMVVIAMITGISLHRDIEERTALFLYAFPIHEKRFFLGRFFAAYAVNLLLVLAYVLGMVMMPYLGVGPADKFGPVPWLQLMHGFVLFGMTNIFILTAVSYFGLVVFRNMAASYIGVFVLVFLFLVCEALSANSPFISAIKIADPFGYVYTREVVDSMTVADKNTALLPIGELLLFNRLLWMGIGLAAFLYSYFRFDFRYFIQTAFGSKKKARLDYVQASHDAAFSHVVVPHVKRVFSFGENMRKVWRLSYAEFLNVVRPASFRIVLLVVAVMFFLYMILWNPVYYIGDQVPLTSGMTSTRLHTNFLMIILLMIWSGELFFKDRTIGLWQITDAIPMPSWVSLVSRFIAMCGVGLVISLTMLVSGVAAQVGQGFYDIDWSLYLDDIFGFKLGWLTHVLNIALVFCVAGIVGNRYMTHVLCVGYHIFIYISWELGMVEQIRHVYTFVPGIADYSELNRYGSWAVSAWWYFLMWFVLSVGFLLTGIRYWNRGATRGFNKRFLASGKELGWAGAVFSLLIIGFFVGLQTFMMKEVNAERNFISSSREMDESAAYEKRYQSVQEAASLRITDVDMQLDLFPAEQAAHYRATLGLDNSSEEPVDKLYINAGYFTQIRSVRIEDTVLEKLDVDKVLGMEVFSLPEPLAPGESLAVVIEAKKAYRGLAEEDSRADLAYNGLFMERPVPVIGYDSGRELLENQERKDRGLEMLESRMAPVNDPVALVQNYLAEDASILQGSITVSTTEGQTAFAPGRLQKSWKDNGRNYFRYEMEKPSSLHWYTGSARYAEKSFTAVNIPVTLLYKQDHVYNLEHYTGAIRDGLQYFKTHLGAYPYSKLCVAEIPFYQEPSYAFANTIAISEKEGWYGSTGNRDVVSFIRFSVTRELFRQWILENGQLANVQGADMLWRALPEAMALGFLESSDGEDRVAAIMKKKRRRYGKDRGTEPNSEPPLLYADGIDYLEENKGTLALYHLSRAVGHDRLALHVRTWFESRKGTPLVFRDLYEYLNEQEKLDERIQAMFENVERESGV